MTLVKHSSDQSYSLQVGRSGAERLSLLASVYDSESASFARTVLERVAIAPLRVADIGCGLGSIARIWSDLVGRAEIVAVDRSAEQLNEAARRTADTRIRFCHSAFEAWRPEGSAFDVVATRFFLAHTPDAAGAVHKMAELVRPGGLLIVEEVEIGTGRTTPSPGPFEKSEQLFAGLGDRFGHDYRIGARLIDIIASEGFELVAARTVQPALIASAKQLIALGLEETRDKYLKQDLADRGSLEALRLSLAEAIEDNSIVFWPAFVTQVCGRRVSTRPGDALTPDRNQ